MYLIIAGTKCQKEFCKELYKWNNKRGHIYRQKAKWTVKTMANDISWNGLLCSEWHDWFARLYEKMFRRAGKELAETHGLVCYVPWSNCLSLMLLNCRPLGLFSTITWVQMEPDWMFTAANQNIAHMNWLCQMFYRTKQSLCKNFNYQLD